MGILSYQGKQFYLDGEPFTVLSGAIHYFRVPREYWHDRLLKLKECGLNTVETYTCWNLHEPKPGVFDFEGNLDIGAFLSEAENLGLHVILRPGPYICAEWEFGGLPAWLLNEESLPLRCYDERFLALIRRYYGELFRHVRPHLAANGGGIFMLQVENEYGSYGDDKNYLRAIAEIYRENGADCLCFTSDGTSHTCLTGGSLDEYLAVLNFGSDPKKRMGILEEKSPDRPMMCGEFWSGWFDHWGEEHHVRSAAEVEGWVKDFLDMDASFNLYMFHGGTNFGFMNGANYHKAYQPTVTSYDYSAPLSEAGDRTETYYRIRAALEAKYGPLPPMTAGESRKAAYGKVRLTEKADLFENLERISAPISAPAPKYMEEIGQSYGYLLYRTVIRGERERAELSAEVVHDRAQVFVNGEKRATWERSNPESITKNPVSFEVKKDGEVAVDILVENMGRVNYGPKLRDRKGIHGVRHEYPYVFGWQMYPLPMEDLSGLAYVPSSKSEEGPVFLRGCLTVPLEPCDTFLRLDGFTKGFVMVNGRNIGRYFNAAGPQRTLYVPAPFLKSGENEILVFESDFSDGVTVEFLDAPDLGSI